MNNPFFKNYGPYKIDEILELIAISNPQNYSKIEINDIQDLVSAKKNTITFFHSKKYEKLASNTQASFCITTKGLSKFLPNNCSPIIVENVLIVTASVTKIFYPDSVTDDFDNTVQLIEKTTFNKALA